jgi:hypothetical protein
MFLLMALSFGQEKDSCAFIKSYSAKNYYIIFPKKSTSSIEISYLQYQLPCGNLWHRLTAFSFPDVAAEDRAKEEQGSERAISQAHPGPAQPVPQDHTHGARISTSNQNG